MTISNESPKAKLAAMAAKLHSASREEEARRRAADLDFERKQRHLIDEGTVFFRDQVVSYRKQAIAALDRAAKQLETVGDAPTPPNVARVSELGLETYLALDAEYRAQAPAHRSAVREVGSVLIATLQGLHRLASDAKREALALGLPSLGGVGVATENQHRFFKVTEKLEAALGAGVDGSLTAVECGALAKLLAEPDPEPQQPSPKFPQGIPNPVQETAVQIAARVREFMNATGVL